MQSSGKSAKNNFVMQASILAIAGIITRVIGLLYRSPLLGVIGNTGNGMYSSAYTYYTIILLISSYSIPSAISKVIAQKLAVKEYNNAHRMFKCALMYVLVVGGIGSMVLFFGARLFVEGETISVLRVFAPTIFVYGILGVLRGYFQAHRSMVQTSFSQIIEQIVNAVVSVGAAYLFIKIGMGTMEVPTDKTLATKRAVYGAMGSALGTGAGVLSALIIMFLLYLLNRKVIMARVRKDVTHEVESYGSMLKEITFIVTPFILSTAIYNLSASVNNKIFTDFYAHFKGIASSEIQEIYGFLGGDALVISNIPIAFASAMASAMIPSIASHIAAGEKEEAKNKIALATKVTMIISIPCAVGLFSLGKPITSLLFPSLNGQGLEYAARLLMVLSVSVIFYALSTLNSSILQGIGKVNTPIVNAGIALVIQTLVACIFLFGFDLGIYALAIANIVYAGMMAFMNQHATKKALGYKQEIVKTFLLPLVSAAVMGLVSYPLYKLVLVLTGSMRISVLPALVVAVIAYFVMMIVIKGLTEEELRVIPKGGIIIRVAKKCHLM